MAFLRKSSPCKGYCPRSKEECAYAHSVKEWKPSHPKMMCSFGRDCRYKTTACCRIHDGSLSDKIRCAEFYGIEFIEPHHPVREERLPVVSVPQVPFVWDNFVASVQQEPVPEPMPEPVPEPMPEPIQEPVQEPVQEEPILEEDPVFQLRQEKRMIMLEMESLRIAKEQLKVRMLLFKMKASDYWEAGSADMEIDMRI
jgi:hypothetical protein